MSDYNFESLLQRKRTVAKFLKVRGYDTSEDPDFDNMTLRDFKEWVKRRCADPPAYIEKLEDPKLKFQIDERSAISEIYKMKDDKKLKIFVFFMPTIGSNVGKEPSTRIIRIPVIMRTKEVLVLSEKEFTSQALLNINSTNIQDDYSEGKEKIYNFTVYVDEDFLDIPDHCFAPKVLKIYKGKEADEFVKREKLIGSKKEFSSLWLSDPITKFYGGHVGDIFEIQEKSISKVSLLKENIKYCCVFPDPETKNKKR